MDLTTTLAVAAVAAALFLWSLWGSRRKRPLGEVSLMPWNGILFVSLIGLIFMAAHLLTLLKS